MSALRFTVRAGSGMRIAERGDLEFRIEPEGLLFRLSVRRRLERAREGMMLATWEQVHSEKAPSRHTAEARANAWLDGQVAAEGWV